MFCVLLWCVQYCMLYLFANELMNNYRNFHLEIAVVRVCVIGVSPYIVIVIVTVDTMLRHILLLLDFVPEYKCGKY